MCQLNQDYSHSKKDAFNDILLADQSTNHMFCFCFVDYVKF